MVPLWGIKPPDTDPARLALEGEGIAVLYFADARLENLGLLGTRDRQLGRDNKPGKCHENRESDAINHWGRMPQVNFDINPGT